MVEVIDLHGGQAVYGIAGKTGNGLGDDQVDLPGKRIGDHSVETIAFLGAGAGNTFIYLDYENDTRIYESRPPKNPIK